jgi:hypothetical protein
MTAYSTRQSRIMPAVESRRLYDDPYLRRVNLNESSPVNIRLDLTIYIYIYIYYQTKLL